MTERVVVVCSANMCRSPMAAGYFKKRLRDAGKDGVDVVSAALYYDGGSGATEGARVTAEQHGFNLADHRSQFLDDALYHWADEVLVMTISHKHDLQLRFPDSANGKVFMLGAFQPGREELADAEVEVMDPYGSAHSTYATVFDQIRESIDGWIATRFR